MLATIISSVSLFAGILLQESRMDPTVIISVLALGIALLLVGLVGKVKAKEIEVGTNNKAARITIGILGLGLTVLAVYGIFNPVNVPGQPTPIPATPTEPVAVVTQAPAVTQPPVTPLTQPPAEPASGSTRISSVDGMVMLYVPAGKFSMGDSVAHAQAECKRVGSSLCDTISYSSEAPAHLVSLNAFWIDQTEVTNAMYAQCVQAGQCIANGAGSDQLPAVNVAWTDASSYCAWAGRRLPSEAEWEKAARGTDGRTFPWGNPAPTCSMANFTYSSGNTCAGGLEAAAVGSYPDGASYYGALDMAGNVWEWVADWFDGNYYSHSPQANPGGPGSTGNRVMRGGSYGNPAGYMRTTGRGYNPPDTKTNWIGFRCAANP